MNTHTYDLMKVLTRFAIAALVAFALTSTVGCDRDNARAGEADPNDKRSWFFFGGKDDRREQRIASLEQQLTTLEARLVNTLADPAESMRRIALWQGVAAAFAVLSGIALVGGAALGSRARRCSGPLSTATSNLDPESQQG